MVIGTRGYRGDIDSAKSTEPGEEPGSVWVARKTKNPQTGQSETTHSYQKGFDGDELKNYVEDYAKKHGHEVKVKKIGGMAKNTVHVQLVHKAKPSKPKQLSLNL